MIAEINSNIKKRKSDSSVIVSSSFFAYVGFNQMFLLGNGFALLPKKESDIFFLSSLLFFRAMCRNLLLSYPPQRFICISLHRESLDRRIILSFYQGLCWNIPLLEIYYFDLIARYAFHKDVLIFYETRLRVLYQIFSYDDPKGPVVSTSTYDIFSDYFKRNVECVFYSHKKTPLCTYLHENNVPCMVVDMRRVFFCYVVSNI